MPLHPLLVSPLIAVLAAGIVDADAGRLSLSRRRRLGWTVGVGLVSLGGFLGAFAFDGALSRAYALVLGESMVVHTSRELLAGLFAVGLAISTTAVLIYGVGTRAGFRRGRSST